MVLRTAATTMAFIGAMLWSDFSSIHSRTSGGKAMSILLTLRLRFAGMGFYRIIIARPASEKINEINRLNAPFRCIQLRLCKHFPNIHRRKINSGDRVLSDFRARADLIRGGMKVSKQRDFDDAAPPGAGFETKRGPAPEGGPWFHRL
jgi:hypothetical protein